MSDYLNLSLISEAIVLDVLCDFESISSVKTNDLLRLKRLDLILSTVLCFADAFSEMFCEIFETCSLKHLSEKDFLGFIAHRSLILCGKKTYFNLMLVCGFMSEILYSLITSFSCVHFAKLTWRCLLEIIKKEFGDLLGEKNWCEGLLSYCDNINLKVDICSVEEAHSAANGETNLLGKEALIKQFKNLNTNDSDMKDEESKLQVNSDYDIGNSDSLATEAKPRQMIMEGTDLEFVNSAQTTSNLSLPYETQLADWAHTPNFKMPNFLYELLTDSSEHLDEILKLVDKCAVVDPNQSSLTAFEFLLGDMQQVSAMVVQKECPNRDSSICPSCNLSGGSHSECSTLMEINEVDSECPLNESENKGSPLKYCELCKGKEKQYLKNWEFDFLERYPEMKHNIKNEDI